MKKVLKMCGVPIMLMIKMIVVLLGAMIFFLGLMLNISNGIIGGIVSVISGITNAVNKLKTLFFIQIPPFKFTMIAFYVSLDRII